MIHRSSVSFFFFNDTATTEIYPLSLHDALPIYLLHHLAPIFLLCDIRDLGSWLGDTTPADPSAVATRESAKRRLMRSEEHTSELQSLAYLVCRLLLEKKKKKQIIGVSTCSSLDD